MKLKLIDKKVKADIEIVLVENKKIKENKALLKTLKFKAELEEAILLPEAQKIYVGCEDSSSENIKLAMSAAIKKLNGTNFQTASVVCDEDLDAMVQGLILGNYTFTQYKSKKEEEKSKTICIEVSKVTKKVQSVYDEAYAIASSVNMVRDIVNTTPDDFYPSIMAAKALQIASENKLKCDVYDEDYLEQTGMGSMLAVGRASRHRSKLIHLTYTPKGKAKKKIVFVGKGLTYDSGGLSLKPSDFMVSMKSDKSGGSAVLGIMNAISKLDLPFEVHGIIGAVENMIGGDAFKPDDVLTARNGTTIEVRNTDAEGRLVLADCLCYAQDEIDEIDYIFDIATLTGACVVGVGEYTTGVMGNSIMTCHHAVKSALNCGEYATTLPFNRYLKKTIKSEIADVCNISSTRYGGAITAGMFLDNFIKEENKDKWVHLDIAGPAYVEKAWGYNPHGASGAGVRTALQFMKDLNNR
ncbi:MAG: leucyl aminopeptidase [Campylobacterota bacterium]|nr:leucyl aminopeptidase [Campylobacterota bacterium]